MTKHIFFLDVNDMIMACSAAACLSLKLTVIGYILYIVPGCKVALACNQRFQTYAHCAWICADMQALVDLCVYWYF